jgi:hypothetical protein
VQLFAAIHLNDIAVIIEPEAELKALQRHGLEVVESGRSRNRIWLKLEFWLSVLHSHCMAKFVVPILALGVAVMTATVLWSFAHDGLGIHRDTIRIDALASAAVIGFALAGHALLRRK